MSHELLTDCLPLLGWFAGAIVVLAGIGLLIGKPDWSSLKRLHGDEVGGVQSLSFVLTLPLFAMIMLFILQISQLLIARIVVEYAAFNAVRSAVVWIPANVPGEPENQMSRRIFLRMHEGDDDSWAIYRMQPTGPKYERIALAASTALTPICPSANMGAPMNDLAAASSRAMEKAYYQMAPGSEANTKIDDRLRNKMAYAIANTRVEIEVWHKSEEPVLRDYFLNDNYDEFAHNEIGWQDQVHVILQHDFALLPGPGRLLARKDLIVSPSNPQPPAPVANTGNGWTNQIEQRNPSTFVHTITRRVRLNNEGQQSIWSYSQSPLGAARGSNAGY